MFSVREGAMFCNIAMWELYNDGCGVQRVWWCFGHTVKEPDEFGDHVLFAWSWKPTFKQNRKQTTCTNEFSMCFVCRNSSFVFAEAGKNLFGCTNASSQRCVRTDAFFILRTEGSKGAKLGSKQKQRQKQQQNSLVVSFGSLE